MSERTGLDLTPEEAEDLHEAINAGYEGYRELWEFAYERPIDAEGREEVVNAIIDEWLEMISTGELQIGELGYYGDVEVLTDLEGLLWPLAGHWRYTVYYQKGEGHE
jgi:hypothetical protein